MTPVLHFRKSPRKASKINLRSGLPLQSAVTHCNERHFGDSLEDFAVGWQWVENANDGCVMTSAGDPQTASQKNCSRASWSIRGNRDDIVKSIWIKSKIKLTISTRNGCLHLKYGNENKFKINKKSKTSITSDFIGCFVILLRWCTSLTQWKRLNWRGTFIEIALTWNAKVLALGLCKSRFVAT